MSAKLELVLNEIKQLSLEELVLLLENLSLELRHKTQPSAQLQAQAGNRVKIPGAYQFSAAEIEAHLAAVFTSQELAEMEKTDLSNLPMMSRTSTEILSEDREDRF